MCNIATAFTAAALLAAARAVSLAAIADIDSGNTVLNMSASAMCSPSPMISLYNNLKDSQDVQFFTIVNGEQVDSQAVPSHVFKTFVELVYIPLFGPAPTFKHSGQVHIQLVANTPNGQPTVTFAVTGEGHVSPL